MPVFRTITLLFLLLLSACQTTPGRVPASDPLPMQIAPPPEAATYRAFAEAQLRLEDGDYYGAARLFAEAAEAAPENPTLLLAQADALLRAEDESGALRVAEAALERFPKDIELLLFLGNFYFTSDETDKAIEYFQRAYDLNPEHEGGAFHLIIAITRSGDFDRAITLLKGMLVTRPEFPAAELMLARIYREKGDFAAAETTLNHLIRSEPELDTPLLEMGTLYESRNDGEKAIGYYRAALKLNPENLGVRHHLARLHVQQGDLAAALTELDEILRQNPGDLEARRKVGLIRLERKEYGEAIRVFRALIESAPELDQVRFYLGTAYERLGDLEGALPHFEAVSQGAEIYGDALTHRAFILHKLGRLAEATTLLEEGLTRPDVSAGHFLYLASLYETQGLFEQVLSTLAKIRERFPDDPEVAYRLGLLYERRQQPEAALAEMRRTIALDRNYAEALNYLAYYYADRKENLDEALELAERAAVLKPEGHVLDTLGWVWFARGDFEKASKYLGQALEKIGDDPVVLEHYGDAQRARKAYREAAQAYRRSLDAHPDNPALREKLKSLPAAGGR